MVRKLGIPATETKGGWGRDGAEEYEATSRTDAGFGSISPSSSFCFLCFYPWMLLEMGFGSQTCMLLAINVQIRLEPEIIHGTGTW